MNYRRHFLTSIFFCSRTPFFCPIKKIPIISANEIFYVKPEERIIFRLLSVIKKFKAEDGGKRIPYLIKPDRFIRLYGMYPEGIKNLFRIVEECGYIPGADSWIFPETKKCLIEILRLNYHKLTGAEKKRVELEYKIIKEMGFEPYFVLVYELKEFAKKMGIGMNVRGSATSSFILYLLGLSIVNPIKYNLPFERFLNQRRSEPPDIDLDVEFNQREYLIEEIYKKFGDNYVARIGMVNRFQTQAGFRNSARAFGISPAELKRIKDHLGEKLILEISKLAEKIDNYPHYFAAHPSGIVITPEPVFKYVPLYPSPSGAITQFDKDGITITGLIKIDILGVRGFPELYLKRDSINFDDQSLYKFISQAKTIGCFQIESPMVRQILKKIKPRNLMDIANAIAIIRPGPARGGMKERFLKRLNGEELIDYPASCLEDILKDTLGIPIYQEQILNMANRFARFSLEDADLLRRAMTKERDSNLMCGLREKFFRQASALEYTKEEIEKVWQRISAFSEFGFNKAHSITYATLAYLSAYQKFYNPLEFFCRLLNNDGGYYPFYAYINEARRWGIKISGPDINRSEYGFSMKNGLLLTGLSRIRNLTSPTIKKILQFRPFQSPEQFYSFVNPDMEEGMNLIKSGAMDLFDEPWTSLYFKLLKSNFSAKRKTTPEQKLIIREGQSEKCFSDFNQEAKLKFQFLALGFLPSQHILEFLYPERKIRISDILSAPRKIELTCLAIAKRTILTRDKKYISFYTVDDETGHLETIMFINSGELDMGHILRIKGYLKNDYFYALPV